MGNNIGKKFSRVVEQMGDFIAGGIKNAATIILVRHTVAAFQATLALLTGTPAGPGGVPPAVLGVQEKWTKAKTARGVTSKAYQAALVPGRKLLRVCVNVLKPVLGDQWNNLWNEAGFTNASLAIPDNPHAMLIQMANYLASNPSRERLDINGVDCTAAACYAAAQLIQDTQAARNSARADAVLAKNELAIGMNAGRNRMIGGRNELSEVLANDDPRWLDYGFQMPAFMSSPDVPEGFTAVSTDPGEVRGECQDADRADSYRFVVTDAADVVLLDEIVWEPLFIGDGLTSGSTVKVKVSARNITGESQFTAPITVVVT